MSRRYDAVRACALAMLGGAVLQTCDVSAGRGLVVDWRIVKSGEAMLSEADPFDVADLFVALVGPEAALSTVGVEPVPEIVAFMRCENGGRRRRFEVGGFAVYVEPHEDDAGQAAFTGRLAALAVGAV